MATYITREGDMLDDVCWKQYGRQSGAVEAVLAANEGLADIGPTLPANVTIELPDLPADQTETVRLWD